MHIIKIKNKNVRAKIKNFFINMISIANMYDYAIQTDLFKERRAILDFFFFWHVIRSLRTSSVTRILCARMRMDSIMRHVS